MRFSPAPDLSARSAVLAAAAAASLVSIVLMVGRAKALSSALGDTDDAMRLVDMRELLAGRGWYDQAIARLQPPHGVFLHWSRLIDGGLAGLYRAFGLFLSPQSAEIATRFVWPVLWIFPAAAATLLVARRLGGGRAVFAGAILLVLDKNLYLQFLPGRIDHHGPQIALAVLAFGGAALESVAGAAIAGAATGLGFAIGLEALVFEVIVGAFIALAFVLRQDADGRRLRAYAIGLGATALATYLIQTPPPRWSLSVCDAMGANLIGGLAVAVTGLLAAVAIAGRLNLTGRLAAVVLSAAAAGAMTLALHPVCAGGPFAEVAAEVRLRWLANVSEMEPFTRVWLTDRASAYAMAAPWLLGWMGWAWLGRRKETRRDVLWICAGAFLAAASLLSFRALRMATYADWAAVPIIAAATADLAGRYLKALMIPTALVAALAAPQLAASAATVAGARVFHRTSVVEPGEKALSAAGERCDRRAAFHDLAHRPAGLVLSEPDLGPFILAFTSSSALTAPYHRLGWGFDEAHKVLDTEAEAAQAEARGLGIRYFLECPAYASNLDRVGLSPASLQRRLDREQPPSWLQRVDDGKGELRLYVVREPQGTRSP